MPFIVLIALACLAALAAGALAAALRRRHGVAVAALDPERAPLRGPGPAALVEAIRRPGTSAGLLLAPALAVLAAGGVAVGALAFFVRSRTSVDAFDASINRWAHDHATPLSTNGLTAATHLGATTTVIVLGVVLAVVETARTRNRWIVPFLLAVLAGEQLLSTTIKELVDRARPTLNPVAATLGPSFPSGHTTAAAAFFAAAAFLLAQGRNPRLVPVLVGAAVGIAVGVAASRVLLGVHWVTDTFAGLALGWAWFTVCAVVLGGRLLGAPAAPSPPGARAGALPGRSTP